MGTIEAMEMEIESMMLNGNCESANRYLEEAAIEIKRALSDLSDAEFEISTSPVDEDWDDEDDGAYEP
ncbi:MAG: hypothetical protein LUG56_03045 [Lachnospiraceae bacterium]|nr:hypothetical protein [Lachnospiraceae bacterium]